MHKIASYLLVISMITGVAVPTVVAQGVVTATAQNMRQPKLASTDKLDAQVSINFINASLKTVLQDIAKQASLDILFGDVVAKSKYSVTIQEKNISARHAINKALVGSGITYAVSSQGQIVFEQKPVSKLSAGQGLITGKITDAKTGKGVSGANISVGSDTRGAVSDDNGSYWLAGVAAGRRTLTVRLVGYAKQTRSIIVGDGATVTVDFKLEPSANVLDQVVVTGSVVATELKAIPNAITVITAKQIEERGITRIDQLFRGDVPGLFAQNRGAGSLLDEVTMFSRGGTALATGISAGTSLGTNPIKTYLDGVELADPKYLSQIDPKTIERIEILTGPQASAIYGSNALNGVMQVFTKRGTSLRPQVSLSLLSGWVANNFSSSLTPQHDYNAQLSGVESRISYNVGGTWQYAGPWTPTKQSTRMDASGSTRLETSTTFGGITTDFTVRRGVTESKKRGSDLQGLFALVETGWYPRSFGGGVVVPTVISLTSQTFGLTANYTPVSWWSHEFGLGQDAYDMESRSTERGYESRFDTTLQLTQNHSNKRSLRYTTTLRVPVSPFAQLTVIGGADSWQSLFTSVAASSQVLTGSLSSPSISRQPEHNSGGFVQAQAALKDQLFFTYGLRAEWNPNYGEEVEPNYTPRYGIAYTRELGLLTAKLRGSYGRATRPPSRSLKTNRLASNAYGQTSAYLQDYGDFDVRLENPLVGPEYQQGGEGGLELYFGSRGSIVVTRYNQTVDDLIEQPLVDSARSNTPNPPSGYASGGRLDSDGYGYMYQYQYLNVGSVRNQGWETQGNVNFGPLVVRGTYSWTKSRLIGITPKYRKYFASIVQFNPGSTFQYHPEHLWALNMSYSNQRTTVALNVSGIGQLWNIADDFAIRNLFSSIRLTKNRQNMSPERYVSINDTYETADFIASHKFRPNLDGVLQVHNLTDRYTNDFYAAFPTIGRQIKTGVRWRL